jgi:hypothetical protein
MPLPLRLFTSAMAATRVWVFGAPRFDLARLEARITYHFGAFLDFSVYPARLNALFV